jgi:hypothetical protein
VFKSLTLPIANCRWSNEVCSQLLAGRQRVK